MLCLGTNHPILSWMNLSESITNSCQSSYFWSLFMYTDGFPLSLWRLVTLASRTLEWVVLLPLQFSCLHSLVCLYSTVTLYTRLFPLWTVILPFFVRSGLVMCSILLNLHSNVFNAIVCYNTLQSVVSDCNAMTMLSICSVCSFTTWGKKLLNVSHGPCSQNMVMKGSTYAMQSFV